MSVFSKQGIKLTKEAAEFVLNRVKQQTDHPKSFTIKELVELYKEYDAEQKNS